MLSNTNNITIQRNNDKIAPNTAYYRKNKKERKIIYNCPDCNYETTGPKCILENHIHAKHTQECDKPFHCRHCEKGFSQKAHLQNHLIKSHDVPKNIAKPPVKPKNIFMYSIQLTNKKAKSKATLDRINFYIKNPRIFTENLKSVLVSNKPLKPHHIHYDVHKGYIFLETYTKDDYLNLNHNICSVM